MQNNKLRVWHRLSVSSLALAIVIIFHYLYSGMPALSQSLRWHTELTQTQCLGSEAEGGERHVYTL